MSQAAHLLRELLNNQPNHLQALYLLAQTYVRANKFEKALTSLKRYIEILTNSKDSASQNAALKETYLQIAQLQAELGLDEEADYSYSKLVEKFSDWPVGLFSYAGFLQSYGQLEQAKETLNQLLKLQPSHSGALLALSLLTRFNEQSKLFLELQQQLEKIESTTFSMDTMKLHYALGKAYDDLSNYDKAFQHWQDANQIQLASCQFRVSQMQPFFAQLKTAYSKLFQTAQPSSLNSSSSSHASNGERSNEQVAITPIFIVGLPRTGSTLLEQMLVQHTQISSMGETNLVAQNLAAGIQTITKQSYPLGVESVENSQWQELGEVYLTDVSKRMPNSRFIIDKLPANFQSIGLIKKAIPHAIIVHLKRDIRAVALSVFRNYFAANEPYFCDLNEFASYSELYCEMMAFWKKLLPEAFIELDYQQLVLEPKAQLKRILELCQLDWQSACLDFHQAHSGVKTISNIQVKQPIYRTSLDSWQNYKAHLIPYFANI